MDKDDTHPLVLNLDAELFAELQLYAAKRGIAVEEAAHRILFKGLAAETG